MKTNAVPELSSKWWSNNKTKLMKSTGLGKALKTYEIAADSMNYDAALTALSEVKKKVAVAIKACGGRLQTDTLAALKRYPIVINKQEKKLTDLKAQFLRNQRAALQNQQSAPKKQKLGSAVTIWERDISDLARKKGLPDWVKDFRNYKMKLTLNGDILDALEAEKDMVTPAYMAEDAEKLGQRLALGIVKLAQNIDTASKGRSPQEVDKLRAQFGQEVKKLIEPVKADLPKIPALRWKKFVADNKAYHDYKIKAAADMTIGVLNTTASALGIVGTGGAGLALGIVALVRAVADLAKQCYNLALEAESVEKDLASDLAVLNKRYHNAQGNAKKAQGATEVGHTVIKSLLGVDTPFIATLPKCNSNYGLWINKVQGLSVAGRKLSSAIVNGIDDCGKLEKKIAKSNDAKARKIYDKILKTRKVLDKALNDCSAMMKRVSNAEGNMEKLKRMLDALNVTNPNYADIFEKVAPRIVGLALSGASAGVGLVGAKSTLETVNAALGLVKDVELEGKAALETALG